ISPYSTVVSATTPVPPPPPPPPPPDTTPPSVPTALVGTPISCQEIDLVWGASVDSGTGLKAYNLYRNTVLFKQLAPEPILSAHTWLSATTTYSYAVTAVDNAANESVNSNTATATTLSCPTSTGSVSSAIIDSGTLGETSTIQMRGRTAEIGGKSAVMYSQG